MTGFEVAQVVHHENIQVNLVFLTMHKDDTLFNKAMDIGVKGFLLKENTVMEIVQCVQTVLDGRSYLSPAISDLLIRRNKNLMSSASDKRGINMLTPAELTIMKKLAEMKTSRDIADELNVSIKTVQNHRQNICNKLDLNGTHALLRFAIDNASLI